MIPKNFSLNSLQVVREIHLERNKVLTLDFILERQNQKKVKDFDHLNLFTGDEILHPESKIWIWGRTSLY